jgi:hypothetical protein
MSVSARQKDTPSGKPHWRGVGSAWEAHTAIRLWWEGGQVVRIRDYIHVDYLLGDATTASVEKSSALWSRCL